jgi:AraC-like DNA-binding protein
MKLSDTTAQESHTGLRTIFSSTSARNALELSSRLRFHILGLYYSEVGKGWSSRGSLESDYLHHIDIAISGRRQVVFQGEVLEVEPGQAYWFPGNTPMERRCEVKCQVIWLKLRSEWLPGIDPFLDWPLRRPAVIGQCDLNYWQAWLDPKFKPTANRLLSLQAWILESIAKVIPDLDGLITEHLTAHAKYNTVFTLIENKLGADLRIEELAQAHGTSTHAFSMSFSRNTGMTPKDYLKRRLNQEAILLVTNTDLKMKEIAGRLKFSDEYHFIRFFHKMNGRPPLQFRKSIHGVHL